MPDLPEPTIIDVIDNAVGAVNDLMMYVFKLHDPRPPWWPTLVEADYLLNTVQDEIREENNASV